MASFLEKLQRKPKCQLLVFLHHKRHLESGGNSDRPKTTNESEDKFLNVSTACMLSSWQDNIFKHILTLIDASKCNFIEDIEWSLTGQAWKSEPWCYNFSKS